MPLAQLTLNLRDPRYRRPTMSVDSAKGALDRFEDEIEELVGNGTLIAWNIAGPLAQSRELRILTRSVAAEVHQVETPLRWNWSDILQLMLPPPPWDKPWIRGTDFQRSFNCGSTHVINLLESRVLQVVPGTTWQRGPGGSPYISKESYHQFLRDRLETANHIRGLK